MSLKKIENSLIIFHYFALTANQNDYYAKEILRLLMLNILQFVPIKIILFLIRFKSR